jgi:hypothetical protein
VTLCHYRAMSQRESDASSAASQKATMLPLAGWLIALLLMLYPLSVAPVMKFTGGRPSRALQTFYAPLEFLYDHNPAIRNFYDWYFELWNVR